MERRAMLGVLGATAAGLAAPPSGAAHARQTEGHGPIEKDKIHQKCAEACFKCEHECSKGFHYCYKQVQAGKLRYARPMQLCNDAADICSTTGRHVARVSSAAMVHTGPACAEICDTCARECEKFHDPGLNDVLKALRECTQSCREMVKFKSGKRPGGERGI